MGCKGCTGHEHNEHHNFTDVAPSFLDFCLSHWEMTSSLQLETIGGIHENGEISTGLPPPWKLAVGWSHRWRSNLRRKLGALEVSSIDFKDRWIRPYRRLGKRDKWTSMCSFWRVVLSWDDWEGNRIGDERFFVRVSNYLRLRIAAHCQLWYHLKHSCCMLHCWGLLRIHLLAVSQCQQDMA